MQIIYGTGNPAKISHMRNVLQGLSIGIIGLDEAGIGQMDVPESGSDPMENARIKAQAYYAACRRPVFSCDSGLYIKGLPESLQPGVNVRTVGGKRLSDEEMIEYYSGLVSGLGGRAEARYRNAICLIAGDGVEFSHCGEDIASKRFLLSSVPHTMRNEGFPLDSLSLEISSGKYYYDLNDQGHIDTDHREEDGFREFFKAVMRKLSVGNTLWNPGTTEKKGDD